MGGKGAESAGRWLSPSLSLTDKGKAFGHSTSQSKGYFLTVKGEKKGMGGAIS